ncbi:MAG: hypothetical protein EON92_00270 [Burkholderiales bacterium]|nr:MAG: hypothetical protein EON92_00270 [Burkholderiales bacterium]
MIDPIPPEIRQVVEERIAAREMQQDPLERKFADRYLRVAEGITVEVTDFRSPYVGLEPGNYPVWLVIRGDIQSVFYDPMSRSFGACLGPEIGSGGWLDLGFRSDDPYAMYVI